MIHIFHMPKTAGTSLRTAVRRRLINRLFVRFHEHDVNKERLKIYKGDKVLIGLRDPRSWYSSLYKHKLETEQKLWRIKNYPIMPNNDPLNFYNDCVVREDPSAVRKWFKPWNDYHDNILNNANLTIYQSFMKYYLTGLQAENVVLFEYSKPTLVADYVNTHYRRQIIKEVYKENKTKMNKIIDSEISRYNFDEDLTYYASLMAQYQIL